NPRQVIFPSWMARCTSGMVASRRWKGVCALASPTPMALSAMATMKPVRAIDISLTPLDSVSFGERPSRGPPVCHDNDGGMSPSIAGVIKGAHAISVPDLSGKTKSRMSDDLSFAAEFPAATREQWVALASRVLKGRPFESLTAQTADGLAISPLYSR